MAVDCASQTVLITGASSGIGRSLAVALAARGSSLVLVARRAGRLESLAAELRAAHRVQVTAIPFDLAAPDAGTELRDAAASRGVTVTSLVNNAGFGTFGQFLDEDPARLAREIAVDVSAPVQLCHAFLPQLVAAGTGFLVNVASMAAYTPTPRMAVYGAAKAFVLSFTESLWAELRGTGLTVFALSPGATSTEFNAVVGTDNATAGARMRTPDDVAATALAHLDRRNPGPSVIDGQANRTSAAVIRLAPRRMTAAMMERVTDPSRRTNLSARLDWEVRSSRGRWHILLTAGAAGFCTVDDAARLLAVNRKRSVTGLQLSRSPARRGVANGSAEPTSTASRHRLAAPPGRSARAPPSGCTRRGARSPQHSRRRSRPQRSAPPPPARPAKLFSVDN
jgi:short-subunit dehydrogenase